MTFYAPFDVQVTTPRLELRGATDTLLERLAPLVRSGQAMADPPPWDDPSSFYEADPDARVRGWLHAIWRRRGAVSPDRWRLYFVVLVDGDPVGQQDLTGEDFHAFGAVETTSWVAAGHRRRGIGAEMRSAILHLAFEGLGAREAHSEAAVDNLGSNGVSERLGYVRNGTSWATHNGNPVLGQRWLIDRKTWVTQRRDDIAISGVEACRSVLGIPRTADS